MDSIGQLLRKKVEEAEWDSLAQVYSRLTHTQQRRAQEQMRREVLPTLSNTHFWLAYAHLVKVKPQAFLACIMAAERLAKEGTLDMDCEGAHLLAQQISHEQANKVADMAMPLLCSEQQIESLLVLLNIDYDEERLALLLRQHTPLCYYLLLRTLQRLEHRHDLALRCCRYILRRADDQSLNMVSILRTEFGLHELDDLHLSLRLEPYELSRICASLEQFQYALEGKKPKI